MEGCCSSSSSFVVDRWWLVAGEHVKWSGLRGIKGRVGAGRRHRCECSQITSASLRPTLEPRKKRYEKDGWIDGWLDGWMDGWMDGGEETHPLEPSFLRPHPRVYTLASVSAILTRHAVFYIHTRILWKPCLRTRSLFCFSLLFCAPPDAYHRTSGRRVKYIASLRELLAGRLCSTVVFLPSRQPSRKTCRRTFFESPRGIVGRVFVPSFWTSLARQRCLGTTCISGSSSSVARDKIEF